MAVILLEIKMAKRKVRYGRLILVIFLLVLFIVGLVFASKAIIDLFDKDDDTTIIVDDKDTVIELLDYKVYNTLDILDFNFVVAELKFKNDNGINYSLENLVTDEGIKLNDIYMYQKEIDVNYDFSLLKTTIDVVSSEKEYTFNIFIPYTKTNALLTINDGISGNILKIDTSKNETDINLIKKSEDDNKETNIDSNNYSLSVSKSYISDMMMHNDELYNAGVLNYYTFNITVNSINDGIKITGATFTKDTGDSFKALDSSFSSVKIDNIIDKELKVGDTYALFFDVSSNGEEEANFKGKITFYFSDNTEKTIDTVLN